MRYVWMPPTADSTLGTARKGDLVDLDDVTVDGIRRAWAPIDPLAAADSPPVGTPPPDAPPPAAAPLSSVARDPEPPVVEQSAAAAWLAPIVEAESRSPATLEAPAPRRRGRKPRP